MNVSPTTTRWVHRPQHGPVSWGTAVLIVPTVPLLSFFVLMILGGMENHENLRTVLSPTPWLVAGSLSARFASHRVTRGVGVGLAAGAVTSILLAAMATSGGWQS